MMKQIPKSADAKDERRFERIGENLYRRSNGRLYCRVTVSGKRKWHCLDVEETKNARRLIREWRDEEVLKARGIELPGSVLERVRMTVGKVLDAYVEAGCPTRKMRVKSPRTVTGELQFLNPVREFFESMAAVTLTVANCDKYRDWRKSGGYKPVYHRHGRKVTRRTNGGDRAVDLELGVLSNALSLAVRRGKLKVNPLAGRTRYSSAHDVRHCREVAPTPEGLRQIEHWLRQRGESGIADLVSFLAFSGLRIGEAMGLEWECVDWGKSELHVKREKHGCNPSVTLLPELEQLLRDMQTRATSHLLFPSRVDATKPEDDDVVRRRLTAACEALAIGHVTPHGLRSYFVTQARQSGLHDAVIAMLIGDKTGPSLISQVYGDVRSDHLQAQAKRIQLRATGKGIEPIASIA
ncbi:MAG: tyrosine-type recombinase/integrase [Verrucomicrobiia bacterium]